MTTDQFQASADPFGNLLIAGGWVLQPRLGVALKVESFQSTPVPDAQALADGPLWPALPTQNRALIGGSGRTIAVSGLTAGTLLPVGIYVPLQAGEYGCVTGVGKITVSGSNAAIIDGGGTIANLTGWTTAPVGNYTSTTYGQTTYNGGASFSLAAALEGSSVGLPGATVTVSSGTAQTGSYAASSTSLWVSAISANWTIAINTDGTAELRYVSDVMALRPAGPLTDPSGVYAATTAGKTGCNGGAAWQAEITLQRKAPRAGWAYLKIEDVAGVLTSVAGPFFATALPTPSGNFYYYPLAKCDGTNAPEQLHLGPVQWSHTSGAAGPTGPMGDPDLTSKNLFLLGL